LEALDIFLNEGDGAVKIDSNDVSQYSSSSTEPDSNTSDIMICAVFSNLPEDIIIDVSSQTSFVNEYLLNAGGFLEIIKHYPNGGKTAKVFIKANHPGNPGCSDLLLKKNSDLKKIIEKHKITCENKTTNVVMRKAIWKHFSDNLQLQEREIDASKEDAKNIWEKVKEYLPIYFLFQSDRKNTDGDNEVQNPLAFVMKQILQKAEIKEKLDAVTEEIKNGLAELSNLTLEKLQGINPELARTLKPNLPDKSSIKWDSVFKGVTILGDNNIPINNMVAV